MLFSIDGDAFMKLNIFKNCLGYTRLAVILIDFLLKKDENYYPQVFLKECKYIGKDLQPCFTWFA